MAESSVKQAKINVFVKFAQQLNDFNVNKSLFINQILGINLGNL